MNYIQSIAQVVGSLLNNHSDGVSSRTTRYEQTYSQGHCKLLSRFQLSTFQNIYTHKIVRIIRLENNYFVVPPQPPTQSSSSSPSTSSKLPHCPRQRPFIHRLPLTILQQFPRSICIRIRPFDRKRQYLTIVLTRSQPLHKRFTLVIQVINLRPVRVARTQRMNAAAQGKLLSVQRTLFIDVGLGVCAEPVFELDASAEPHEHFQCAHFECHGQG